MQTIRRSTIFAACMAVYVAVGAAVVAGASTQPENCDDPLTAMGYARVLSITRTDDVVLDLNIDLSNSPHYESLSDSVIITRRRDPPAKDSGIQVYRYRCCSECRWPRKNYHIPLDSGGCIDHCLIPVNTFLLKLVNGHGYRLGHCLDIGYGIFAEHVPSKGLFSPAADYFHKYGMDV